VTDRRVLCLVGPRASGKTALSIELAKRLSGEIVSADSRQVYRRMDIGTAKPSLAEREGIPHFGLDLFDPDKPFNAGEYGQMARGWVEDILGRGRLPIVVGGSGLYIRALVDGVFEGKYRDKDLRASLKDEAERFGLEALHKRLAEADPEAAGRIHPNDSMRILRALEVIRLSGMPMTIVQQSETRPADFKAIFFGLSRPRAELYRRIELRVDQMIAAGLVKEVSHLKKSGYRRNLNAIDSVGYRELFDHWEGRMTLNEAFTAIKQNSRRFAKKQMTWFRKDKRINWIEMDESSEIKSTADRVLEIFDAS
jgi:tRNA dimethylallyltransferase